MRSGTQKSVGDRSEDGKHGSAAWNYLRMYRCQSGNGARVLGQKLKIVVRIADPAYMETRGKR